MTDHLFPPPQLTTFAGFGRRTIAYLIDTFVILAAITIICLIVSTAGVHISFASAGIPVSLVVVILYYGLLESSAYQATLGKMMLGMKVTAMNGNRISFLRAVGRFLGMFLSSMTFYTGFLMCIWTKNKQCLHDMMAGCLVYSK